MKINLNKLIWVNFKSDIRICRRRRNIRPAVDFKYFCLVFPFKMRTLGLPSLAAGPQNIVKIFARILIWSNSSKQTYFPTLVKDITANLTHIVAPLINSGKWTLSGSFVTWTIIKLRQHSSITRVSITRMAKLVLKTFDTHETC